MAGSSHRRCRFAAVLADPPTRYARAIAKDTFFKSAPLRRALVARARQGRRIPATFNGLMRGNLASERQFLDVSELIGDARLLDLMVETPGPGVPYETMERVLEREAGICLHDLALREAGNLNLERGIRRIIQDRSHVSLAVAERILDAADLGGAVAWYAIPELKPWYWRSSATGKHEVVRVPLQRPMSESHPCRTIRRPEQNTSFITEEPQTTIPSRSDRNKVRELYPASRQQPALVVKMDAGELLEFDRVAIALGLSRSTLVRRFIRETISVARAGQAAA